MSFAKLTNSQNHRYMLQLVLSCRKITAQVSDTSTATATANATIVAIASSSRQDFYSHYHSKLNPFPKHHRFWDSKTAALVGQKLGSQLREIGVTNVMIDLAEELSRPANQRILVRPLFDSVRRAGVVVAGFEKLGEIGHSMEMNG